MSDEGDAQLSQNTLESIANQPNLQTSAQFIVGDGPISIGVTSGAIYVANFESDTVTVIDPITTSIIKNIHVGIDPSSMDISTFNGDIYVLNIGSDTISVIDPTTNTVKKNLTAGYASSTIGIDSYNRGRGANFSDLIYVGRYVNTVSVINPDTNTVIKNITVGPLPSSIGISSDAIYVANAGSDTVSVINPNTNTVTKNITVGESPRSIGISSDAIYVANFGSNSISVINPDTNTVINNITVGVSPASIGIAPDGMIYVTNFGSGTISVIEPFSHLVLRNITVGDKPASIGMTSIGTTLGDTIYVANFGSNSISVINRFTFEAVAGISLDINPFRGGQIICNGLDAPINRYFYVSSGTECVGKPNNGFEFDSWVETFDGNSSRTINASTTSDWFVDPMAALRDVFTDDPAANLTVNRFGNFTAYFKELPPPVPAEYWASLFTIVVTALVGSLLIPAAVSWFKSKKQTSRLNSFHLDMISINKDGLDETDIKNLNELNQRISNSYAAGKITNEQYTNLKNDVSAAYQKIFKKRIESITSPNSESVNNIKNDIEEAYSDGKINELHYNLIMKKISDRLNNRAS
jgi:YVTN family beta-propeller protein